MTLPCDSPLADLRITAQDAALVRAATLATPALNRTAPVELAATVFGSVAHIAAQTPDRTALQTGTRTLTYAQLSACVAELAGRVTALGVARGDVVAVVAQRSAEVTVAFLALELVGAVYLPVDRGWPPQRREQILKSSGAAAVLSDSSAPESSGQSTPLWLSIADSAEPRAGRVLEAPAPDPTELRYVIYTSGTTGTPKGASVEHRGMVNHLQAKIADLALGPEDRIAFTAPIGFDISVWQMLCPLVVGGTSVIVEDAVTRFPRSLVRAIRDTRLTVAEVVPTVAAWIARECTVNEDLRPTTLRWLLSTGEEIGVSLAGDLLRALPGVGLLNAYGPTECSDDVTHHVITAADAAGERVPIGVAVANCALYLLAEDADGWRAARPGEAAHLFVGGVCVGRGYLARPDLTRAAFYRDTFDADSPTGRLYHTGDLVRLDRGVLSYLSRSDRQVKIAGVRMELDEIEAVLARHEEVAECAVLLGEGGRVEAWIAASPAGSRPADSLTQRLRGHAQKWLPAAAVPTVWTHLDRLPRTGNDKVDHRQLRTGASPTR